VSVASPGSITVWLKQLRADQADAAQQLWEGCFRQLVGLARQKLLGRPRAAADEEDVALSAFHSFCGGVDRDRFPHLADRDDLWQLLVLLTASKAAHLTRDETRRKRGGGAVVHTSALADEDDRLAELIGPEPTPEFAAQVAEEYRLLLDRLGDDELRAVVVAKLENDTNKVITQRLNRSPATMERKLGLIRRIWEQEIER
jgi:hypothetical protein